MKLTHLDDDSNNAQCIYAYPLSEEDHKTGEVIELPPTKFPSKKRLTPTSIAIVDTISSVRSRTLLKVLSDPGSTSTLISQKCLPRHCKPCAITNEHKIHTLTGTCSTKQMVVMRKVILPELDKNWVVEEQKTLVFDWQCKYEVIFGTDFLSKTDIDIKYSSEIIEWFNNELPMHNPCQLDNKEYLAMAEVLKVQCKAEQFFGMDWYNPTCYPSEKLNAKYGKVSMDCVHLNDKQKQDLNSLTPMVAYMQPFFQQASFELNSFSNFCPLTTFDSSKCAQALPLYVCCVMFLHSFAASLTWVEGLFWGTKLMWLLALVYRKLAS